MYKKLTNNDLVFFKAKVNIRLQAIENINEVNVLDCFHGEGKIWDEVIKKSPGKKIQITGIDKNQYPGQVSIIGNNIKYLKELDLSKYNLIDLDGYGIPGKQLKIIFDRKWAGVITCTFISLTSINPESTIAEYYGISDNLIKTSMGCTGRDQYLMFTNFLAANGVKNIKVAGNKKKKYMWFNLDK